MAITSSFANLATVTRASKKTDAGGWDFTSGGTVGTLTEYASGVAALHATAGLLVEESSTNEIRNPRGEGGSSGAAPTYWTGSGVTFDGVGTENGCPYCQISFSSLSGLAALGFEALGQVLMAQSEVWTNSFGIRLISGSLDDFEINGSIRVQNSGGSQLENLEGSDIASLVDASHRRFFATLTVTAATAAAGQPRLLFRGTGTATATFRIYAPQFEEKAYPTSPILPEVSSPAATTRAKDDVYVPIGSWHNDGSGQTLLVDVRPCANSAGYIADLVKDSGERVALRLLGGSVRADLNATINGGAGIGETLGSATLGSTIKIGIAFAEDDAAVSATGLTQATDASCDIPDTPVRLQLGAALISAATHLNCYIRDVRYFPRRVSNAELEAMVGN